MNSKATNDIREYFPVQCMYHSRGWLSFRFATEVAADEFADDPEKQELIYSILDIDLDYFNQMPDAAHRLEQLLNWAACPVSIVV